MFFSVQIQYEFDLDISGGLKLRPLKLSEGSMLLLRCHYEQMGIC